MTRLCKRTYPGLKDLDKTLFDVLVDKKSCVVNRFLDNDNETKKYEHFAINMGDITYFTSFRPYKTSFGIAIDGRKIGDKIYILLPERKQILVREPQGLFRDADKASQFGDYVYFGTIEDALEEFSKKSFEIVNEAI